MDDDFPDKETAIAALAEEFEFDPAEAMTAKWWHMEWIGWTLTACQPYPIWLPRQGCPITHTRLFKIPGQLYGQGFYHRTEWHERIYNKLNRDVIRIAARLGNPPGLYDRGAFDAAALQKYGSKFPGLVPGVWTGVNRAFGPNHGGIPYQPVYLGVDAIEPISARMQYHENTINEITGITDAVEGSDQSRTATQNSNNLQQSMKTIFDYKDIVETDMLLPDVESIYVALQMCYQLDGVARTVSGDPSQQAYKSLVVAPEELLDLNILEFVITGSMSPGNKQNQAQMLSQWSQKWMAVPGLINAPLVARGELEMMGLKRGDQWVNALDPAMLMQKLQNILWAFGGPQGMQAYMMIANDPQISMALSLMEQQMAMGVQGGGPGQPKQQASLPAPDNGATNNEGSQPRSKQQTPMAGSPQMNGGELQPPMQPMM